jgi:hypothetical protein
VDLYEIDRLQYLMAEAQGKPLPDVEIGPELAALIDRVEAQCGYRVMARPHSFGIANGGGSTNHEQRVITLLVHPVVSQEASRRYLYHECAHAQQDEGAFDRETITGYCDCERDADRRAWVLAEQWGDGDLFPESERIHWEQTAAEREDAMWALSSVAGTENALVLAKMATRLLLCADREVGQTLYDLLRDVEPAPSYAAVARVGWESPEVLIGFDRSLLHGNWRVTTMGPPADPLPLTDAERAAKWLAGTMRDVASDWAYGVENNRYSRPQLARWADDEPSIITVWCDPETYGSIAGYVNLVQTLVMREPWSALLGLTWHVSESAESTVYEAELEWQDHNDSATRPTWRVFCTFGPLRHRRDEANHQALRLWINSWRHVAGIYFRSPHETLSHIRWLWSSTERPATEEEIAS